METKGTGRARSGSSRSPIWIGGGTTFGPQPRSYYKAMPRKARRLAVKSALSDKVNNSELYVLEEITLAAPKTKEVLNIINSFNVGDAKVLFITEGDVNVERSARNIQGVKALACEGMNIFDLLHYDKPSLLKVLSQNRGGTRIMQLHDVLIRPVITEKSTMLMEEGKYISVCL